MVGQNGTLYGDGVEAVEIKISKVCDFKHLPTEEACSFACEGERSWVMIWQRSGANWRGAEVSEHSEWSKGHEMYSKSRIGHTQTPLRNENQDKSLFA